MQNFYHGGLFSMVRAAMGGRLPLHSMLREAYAPKPDVSSGQLKGCFTEAFTLEAIVLLNVDGFTCLCYYYVLLERLLVADSFWQFKFLYKKKMT